MIANGEGIAVAPVCQHELALEIRAPEVVGVFAREESRSLSFGPASLAAVDQSVAIQNRMDRADGGRAKIGKLSDQ